MRIAAIVATGVVVLGASAGCSTDPAAAPGPPLGTWSRSTGVGGKERIRIAAASHPIEFLFTRRADGACVVGRLIGTRADRGSHCSVEGSRLHLARRAPSIGLRTCCRDERRCRRG